MNKKEAKAMKDYETQDDLRTLSRAVDIRSDKKRMAAAQKELAKQAKALEKTNKIFPGKRGKK